MEIHQLFNPPDSDQESKNMTVQQSPKTFTDEAYQRTTGHRNTGPNLFIIDSSKGDPSASFTNTDLSKPNAVNLTKESSIGVEVNMVTVTEPESVKY